MLKAETVADKRGYTLIALSLFSATLGLGIFCVEKAISPESAHSFHVWFQFICGNWPSGWDGVINNTPSYFAAAIVLRLFLGLGPIYGLIVIFGKLITLERGQLMKMIDLINLRDILIMNALTSNPDVPDEQKQKVENQLRKAFDVANDELYNEQAPIILGPENAKLLRDHLNRDIFTRTE
jgi:hypothetical protein